MADRHGNIEQYFASTGQEFDAWSLNARLVLYCTSANSPRYDERVARPSTGSPTTHTHKIATVVFEAQFGLPINCQHNCNRSRPARGLARAKGAERD